MKTGVFVLPVLLMATPVYALYADDTRNAARHAAGLDTISVIDTRQLIRDTPSDAMSEHVAALCKPDIVPPGKFRRRSLDGKDAKLSKLG